ncbi:MAG: hypothetical protein KDI47_10445 [Gammaproteobacteria bacterium]|nr:hypothetical protein [Gammaproteobacteria bacterium]
MNKGRLIQLFLLVLAIFLMFRVVPMAGEWQASLESEIVQLEDRRDQLERLLERREEWRERLDRLKSSEADIAARSLPGGRPEVASARLQSLLRSYTEEAGVEVSTQSLPEIEVFGAWRLLQVVVSMRGTEAAVLGMLKRLESDEYLLRVVGFQTRNEGTKLTGSATVVGFSPLLAGPKEKSDE